MLNRFTLPTAEVFKWSQDQGTWYFVAVPRDISNEIRALSHDRSAAWGSIKVEAQIGLTSWRTSLFPDAQKGCYLLPIKKLVRQSENIDDGTSIELFLRIL
ncbi:MAG: DUF1905 domain-containing protein [Planctomycetales bacterium]|nr:DUF1905 domain-containing protein [Planctomycetales bacterium]